MFIRSTNSVCYWSTGLASLLWPGSVPVAEIKAPCPKATRTGHELVAPGRQHVDGTRPLGASGYAPGVSVEVNR